MKALAVVTGILALGVIVGGCADWDNPSALAELEPDIEFELAVSRVETFEEVEVHVHATEGGSPMVMRHAELEVEHHESGAVRVLDMAPEGDGYAVHVTFYEPGEYHMSFGGRLENHSLSAEMGEHEIDVHRRHQEIGPYWVELELSPAPVLEGQQAHIHLLVYELLGDGTPGAPVGALNVEAEVHDPTGVEQVLTVVEEEAGEYEAEFGFGDAGVYELHVEIEVGAEHLDGEFHIPVLGSLDDSPDDHDDGGDGHGH